MNKQTLRIQRGYVFGSPANRLYGMSYTILQWRCNPAGSGSNFMAKVI